MGFTRLTPSKPTLAAISGWCLAGGLELALWCDLRIASEIDASDSRAAVRRATDRRRDPAAASRRRDGTGAGDDPHGAGRPRRGGARLGLVNEVVPDGGPSRCALGGRRGPCPVPADRCCPTAGAAIEGSGLPLADGLDARPSWAAAQSKPAPAAQRASPRERAAGEGRRRLALRRLVSLARARRWRPPCHRPRTGRSASRTRPGRCSSWRQRASRARATRGRSWRARPAPCPLPTL